MAIADLAKHDILDLLLGQGVSDDRKGQYLYGYMEAFMGFLSTQMTEKLKEEDVFAMQKILEDPEVSPDKIEQFYRQRVPDYDKYLFAATLAFKKDFLLSYYRKMLEEMVKGKHASVPLWIQLIATAEEDKWELVARIVKQIEDTYTQPPATL